MSIITIFCTIFYLYFEYFKGVFLKNKDNNLFNIFYTQNQKRIMYSS